MSTTLGFRRDENSEHVRDVSGRSEIVIFPRKSAASIIDTWEAINRGYGRNRDRRDPLSDD